MSEAMTCAQAQRRIGEGGTAADWPPPVLEHLLVCDACTGSLASGGDNRVIGPWPVARLRRGLAIVLVALAPLVLWAADRAGLDRTLCQYAREWDGVRLERLSPEAAAELAPGVERLEHFPGGLQLLEALLPATELPDVVVPAELRARRASALFLGAVGVHRQWQELRDLHAPALYVAATRELDRRGDPAAWVALMCARAALDSSRATTGVPLTYLVAREPAPLDGLTSPLLRGLGRVRADENSYTGWCDRIACEDIATLNLALPPELSSEMELPHPRCELGWARRGRSVAQDPEATVVLAGDELHSLGHIRARAGLAGVATALVDPLLVDNHLRILGHLLEVAARGAGAALALWLVLVALRRRATLTAALQAEPGAAARVSRVAATALATGAALLVFTTGSVGMHWLLDVLVPTDGSPSVFRDVVREHILLDGFLMAWLSRGAPAALAMAASVLPALIWLALAVAGRAQERIHGARPPRAPATLAPALAVLVLLGDAANDPMRPVGLLGLAAVCALLGRLIGRADSREQRVLATVQCCALVLAAVETWSGLCSRISLSWWNVGLATLMSLSPVVAMPALARYLALHLAPTEQRLRRRLWLAGCAGPALLMTTALRWAFELAIRVHERVRLGIPTLDGGLADAEAALYALALVALLAWVAACGADLLTPDGAVAFAEPPDERGPLSWRPVRALADGHALPLVCWTILGAVLAVAAWIAVLPLA